MTDFPAAQAFCARFGISVPIIQAPMAGVSTPALAAAVSGAGGLGSLGLGASDVTTARSMIAALRNQTNRAFNVNFFCHRPAAKDSQREARWIDFLRPTFAEFGTRPPEQLTEIYKSFVDDDAMLATVISERPAIVSFHFGLPDADRIAALRHAGIQMFASATTLEEARQVEAAGVDAVIAQGYEAGGHRGVFDPALPDARLSTLPLTRLLSRHLSVPVIAAGGLMDGTDIAAVLHRGASAAQLGTAFILCPESSADPAYRERLSAAGAQTEMTMAVSGRPARSLVSRFTALGRSVPDEGIPAYPIAYDAGKALHAAAKANGEFGYGAYWAGQGAPFARALPADEMLRMLAREAGLA